jgi:hypothetical protein
VHRSAVFICRGAQAVARGGARCASMSKVLHRCARPSTAAPLVVHRSYLIVAPGRCPRRRSFCVAGT